MNTQDDDELLAAEFVLGLLDGLTRRRLEKRLKHDTVFAEQVAYWQRAFSGIDAMTPEQMPPVSVWQKIERDLHQRRSTKSARNLTGWLGWGLAAAMAGIMIFTYLIKPTTPPTLQPIAILKGEKANAQFIVSLDKSSTAIQVSAFNVALPEAKTLQVWVINGNSPPQSLGLIDKPAGNIYRLAAGTLKSQTLLAISLEPLGGSRLSGPSGPVIFKGNVSLPGEPM